MLAAGLVAVFLVVTGCGGSSDTASTSATPVSSATATPTSSAGAASADTESLDLLPYLPLVMQAAPPGAVVEPATGAAVTVSGGHVIFSVETDTRTLQQAKQDIQGPHPGQTFKRAVVDEADALMYEAATETGASTFLVYVAPAQALGYVCRSRDIAVGNRTTKTWTEDQAREVLAACRSLVKK